ncbi:GFA family protein [Oricola sp.]|uniref:GFA family protein n=1 Tax=Oricola sp. TaxID=1979950 RepID=UPI000C912EC9|nr:aldehyde-activating protein [Ahrensia sp.]|tara:strand:- start:5561 stop:5965 length:405 start_codon:yes stop_codon:yes gene_type:complete
MEKRFRGSCHCGAVAYEAVGDLDDGTARCNCSYCRKTRSWGFRVKPESLRITRGENLVTGYAFTKGRPEHCFCSKCGVHLFGRGNVPELGGDIVSLQIASIDDASIEELVATPVMWCDGLNDNWWNPPEEIRHL